MALNTSEGVANFILYGLFALIKPNQCIFSVIYPYFICVDVVIESAMGDSEKFTNCRDGKKGG
ncbi:MAG: hypothetical protein ACTSYF_15280 [Promethearchaeota archaeon]